jgi:transposase-like protein
MDTKRYAKACAQVRGWLPDLTEAQRAGLRALLDNSAALAQCLQLIAQLRPVTCCPHCGDARLYRHGIVSGLQRYRCRECQRSFNALTNTPLAFLRRRDAWLPYLQSMLDSRTVRAAATCTGIHRNTSFRWRHRFLTEARNDRPGQLKHIVEADETYLLESQKGSRHLTRPARRRGGVAHTRGITNEHDCLLVARQRGGGTCDWVAGRGQITAAKLQRWLHPALASSAVLVSDGAAAYHSFAAVTGIRHEAINVQAGIRVRGIYHVQGVNAYHSRLHQWLRTFLGVASRYLVNYLGWRYALDGGRIGTPAVFLAAALGAKTAPVVPP